MERWMLMLVLLPLVLAGPIEDLQPGEWYEIPNTKLSDIAYNWSPNPVPTINGVGFKGIMSVWSGGTFDTIGNRLLVWGGGHKAYGGNEMYAFDFDDLKWHRVSEPSAYEDIDEDCDPYYQDGLPVARHTYNDIQFVPSMNAMCAIASAGNYCAPSGGGPQVDCYDFDTDNWSTLPDWPSDGHKTTAMDPSTNHLWGVGQMSDRRMYEYDPVTDEWTKRWPNQVTGVWAYYARLVVDPVRKIIVLVGENEYLVFDISSYDTNGYVTEIADSSTGPQDVVAHNAPTLAYDSKRGNMVGWLGRTDVFVLDLDNHTWKRIAAAEDNTVIPTLPTANGVYGRWQYVPSEDVFVIVNTVDENVFVYKPADNESIACNDLDDVILIIHRWKIGEIEIYELMEAIKEWKIGC